MGPIDFIEVPLEHEDDQEANEIAEEVDLKLMEVDANEISLENFKEIRKSRLFPVIQ